MADADDPDAPNYRELRLRDLRPMDVPVMVVGRVLRAEWREVARRADGEKRPVLSGLLSDGTATVRFTWWDPPKDEIEVGTILRAANVLIREFRGRAELTFNSRTRVQPADPSELPAPSIAEFPLVPLSAVSPGAEGFRIEVRVENVRPKTVQVRGSTRAIFEGVLTDGSGRLPFTAWSDLHLVEGSSIRILGATIREFQRRPQVNLDEGCLIEPIAAGPVPGTGAGGPAQARDIGSLESAEGSAETVIRGVAVALVSPSGLVHRCPECRKTTTQGVCRTHGAVTGYPDLRTRLVLDDGTGSATVELARVPTEKLLGRTLDELLAADPTASGTSALEEQLFEVTFGHRFEARGRALNGEFGLTVFGDELTPLSPPDPSLDRPTAPPEAGGSV
jgi:replication factor A1